MGVHQRQIHRKANKKERSLYECSGVLCVGYERIFEFEFLKFAYRIGFPNSKPTLKNFHAGKVFIFLCQIEKLEKQFTSDQI